ncbi:MAG: DAK2 domain-containing protein [Bacillota bacterium]|nr:DAK2 domain-containing protein [Bacillota bacterium]
MDHRYLDEKMFKAALKETVAKLSEKRELLNQINIFPVPDGDTGNNMLATLESALQEVERNHFVSLDEMVEAAYQGAREGSTGNSGAIIAQYLKGWAKALKGLERANAGELAEAQARGAEYAYSAVLRPVEGTILTVAREAAEAAAETSADGNLADTLLASYHRARRSLVETARILSPLRKNKMVDAGGWGMLIFFASLLKVFNIPTGKAEFNLKPKTNYFLGRNDFAFDEPYDMEFVITGTGDLESAIRETLESSGTELITQISGDNCRVHIHTNNPLIIVEKVASLASFLDLIIKDMRSQYESKLDPEESNLKYRALSFGKSPGFLAMYAMAGASVALSINQLEKKKRILEEYSSGNILLISSEEITLPEARDSVVIVEGEARILASLVSLYSFEKPSPEDIRVAAGYPRIARLVEEDGFYKIMSINTSERIGSFSDGLSRAVETLEPQLGEVLTIYYDRPERRRELEILQTSLQKNFPMLEAVDLYFGGQEIPLILSVE